MGFAEIFLGVVDSWFSQSCRIVQGGRGAKTTWSVLHGARKYPYSFIPRGRGKLRAKILKGKYKLKPEFPEGLEGDWIVSGTTN